MYYQGDKDKYVKDTEKFLFMILMKKFLMDLMEIF